MNQNSTTKKDAILITLHGIRTYGKWQKNFNKLVNENTSNFEHYSMKYGFLSLMFILNPFKRKALEEETFRDIERIINENNQKDIHIIAHSFGTYLIIKFLTRKKLDKKIKTLILAASILPKNYFNKVDLTCNIDRLINDCGHNDYSLLLIKILTIKFGDSGRIGFSMSNNLKIYNRYFKGKHKLYFNNTFYEKYWLPHIISDISIKSLDHRRD